MKQYLNNPRKISAKEFSKLETDLDELGDLGGIVHNLRDDSIVGGNQRTKVFKESKVVITDKLGEPDRQGTVAWGYIEWRGARYSYRQVDWDDAKARRGNIRANIAGGDWDWDILANAWDAGELMEWGFDEDLLKDWGQDYSALSAMLESEEEAPEQGDAEPQTSRADELRELWGVELGQTWRAGNHTLYCGDSANWQLARPTGILTDPPYDLDAARIIAIFSGIADAAMVLTSDAQLAALTALWRLRINLIWYHRRPRSFPTEHMPLLNHNQCVLISKDDKVKHGWKRPQPNFSSVIQTEKEFVDQEMGHGKAADIFIELLRGFPWKVVGDPFMGTGATVLACENLGRQCIGAEINPATFAVALQRISDALGVEPQLC